MDGGRKKAWSKNITGIINDEGQVVDPYIPRKCQVTNKILSAQDRSSVQISVAQVDSNGVYNKNKFTFTLSGFVRQKGLGAEAVEKILIE